MTTPLTIDAKDLGDGVGVIELEGEVDVANTPQVREAALRLISGGVKNLVTDLSRVEYMDSSGLGMLVGLLKRLKESDGRLLVAAAQPRVKRLFEITGLEKVLPLYDDASAALKEVGR
jgi:anti-sigma B factor antagonist